MNRATARAPVNIALVKYWGKRDDRLNLPTNNSISMTLDNAYTTTTVTFDSEMIQDTFLLNDVPRSGVEAANVSRVLDLVRSIAKIFWRATVVSHNTWPTAAGLASSASGFAALVAAATRALNLNLNLAELSSLARLGSGSACRSVHGGFVEWEKGEASDGHDSYAFPLPVKYNWPLRLVTPLSRRFGPKGVSSREGMQRVVHSSPLYASWLTTIVDDLDKTRRALLDGNLKSLGTVIEGNALKMHATAMTALPPIIYWQPLTVALMGVVFRLREEGIPAFMTLDAGPHLMVLTELSYVNRICEQLGQVPGVDQVVVSAPGPGVQWL